MKKIIPTLALSLALNACSKEEPIDEQAIAEAQADLEFAYEAVETASSEEEIAEAQAFLRRAYARAIPNVDCDEDLMFPEGRAEFWEERWPNQRVTSSIYHRAGLGMILSDISDIHDGEYLVAMVVSKYKDRIGVDYRSVAVNGQKLYSGIRPYLEIFDPELLEAKKNRVQSGWGAGEVDYSDIPPLCQYKVEDEDENLPE